MPTENTDDFSDLTIDQLNWELCSAHLNDAVEYLKTCREELEKALSKIRDLRDWYER